MTSFNRVTLIGHVARDPEVTQRRQGDKKIVRFTVMTNERWSDSAGEKREKVLAHRIVVVNDKLAELAARYVKKGTLVLVEGQMETRTFQGGDGIERQITEVVLGPYKATLQMLTSKADRLAQEASGEPTREAPEGGDPQW